MKAVLITPEGKTTEHFPYNREDFTLEELYELVDCNIIELIQMPGSCYMIVDENGIANEKKLNPDATKLYQSVYRTPEVLEAKKREEEYYKSKGFAIVSLGNEPGNIYGNALLCPSKLLK